MIESDNVKEGSVGDIRWRW